MHRGVRVECSKQTQNSETKNRGVGVEHRGVRVECSNRRYCTFLTKLIGLM